MKAIIIARVSTEEQKITGNSLPAQLQRLERYCELKGYSIIDTFSFDESAYKTRRDEFDKIVHSITKAKEKIAVCFDKVDRLSRNIFDKRVSLLYEKALNNEIELHFISDGQTINDQMNAGDKFAFGMKLGLAKYYSDAISDNVKRVLEMKRNTGGWSGKVRLGYLNVALNEAKRLRKDIVVDTDKSHLIVKMFELYATGKYSVQEIKDTLTNLGLRSKEGAILPKSSFAYMLKDPFYCGRAVSRRYGSWVHKYPRMISEELFDRCQFARVKKGVKRLEKVSLDFIFRGLLNCKNCGCVITPELKRKPSGRTYVYYSCTNAKGNCKREYIPEAMLLSPIQALFDQFEGIDEEMRNIITGGFKTDVKGVEDFHKAQISRVKAELAEFKRKDDRLLDAFLEQTITKELFEKKHEEYSHRIRQLSTDYEGYSKGDIDYSALMALIMNTANRIGLIFKSSEVGEKREILKFLLQNPVINAKKLEFSIRSPFNMLLESPYLRARLGEVDTVRTFDIASLHEGLLKLEQLLDGIQKRIKVEQPLSSVS